MFTNTLGHSAQGQTPGQVPLLGLLRGALSFLAIQEASPKLLDQSVPTCCAQMATVLTEKRPLEWVRLVGTSAAAQECPLPPSGFFLQLLPLPSPGLWDGWSSGPGP